MRGWMLGGLLMVVVGCGSSSPAAPTPAPIPAASVAGDGSPPQVTLCAPAPFNSCTFTAAVRNAGPGCAAGVRGIVRFFDQSGSQLGPSLNWTLPTNVVLRPGETFAFVVSPVQVSVLNAATTFRAEPAWDNVRC